MLLSSFHDFSSLKWLTQHHCVYQPLPKCCFVLWPEITLGSCAWVGANPWIWLVTRTGHLICLRWVFFSGNICFLIQNYAVCVCEFLCSEHVLLTHRTNPRSSWCWTSLICFCWITALNTEEKILNSDFQKPSSGGGFWRLEAKPQAGGDWLHRLWKSLAGFCCPRMCICLFRDWMECNELNIHKCCQPSGICIFTDEAAKMSPWL